jgi:hypothetical protein
MNNEKIRIWLEIFLTSFFVLTNSNLNRTSFWQLLLEMFLMLKKSREREKFKKIAHSNLKILILQLPRLMINAYRRDRLFRIIGFK